MVSCLVTRSVTRSAVSGKPFFFFYRKKLFQGEPWSSSDVTHGNMPRNSLHGNVPSHSNNGVSGCRAEETGYGAEETGYGAEETGYGAEETGYGAEETGYGAEETGYGA